MNCVEFIRFVEAVPLRERGEEELQQANEHAVKCDSCAARWRVAKELEERLAELPFPAATPHAIQSVMERATRPVPAAKVTARKAGRELVGWAAVVVAMIVPAGVYAARTDWGEWLASLGRQWTGRFEVHIGPVGEWIWQPGSVMLAGAAAALLLVLSVESTSQERGTGG